MSSLPALTRNLDVPNASHPWTGGLGIILQDGSMVDVPFFAAFANKSLGALIFQIPSGPQNQMVPSGVSSIEGAPDEFSAPKFLFPSCKTW